mgnify:CR=1 FL=1
MATIDKIRGDIAKTKVKIAPVIKVISLKALKKFIVCICFLSNLSNLSFLFRYVILVSLNFTYLLSTLFIKLIILINIIS